MTIPKIYPITDRGLSGLSHAEQARRLIAGGARLIQLREKTAPSGMFYEDAAEAVAAAHAVGAKIVINDRVDIALAVGADGVHLGQSDLPPPEARKLLGPAAIIGFSTHSAEQAIAAALEPVSYIAAGPIFGTRTKSDHEPVIGLAGLRAVRAAVGDIPLVAIGGIDIGSVGDVIAAGADLAAIISGIIAGPDLIAERFQQFSRRAEAWPAI